MQKAEFQIQMSCLKIPQPLNQVLAWGQKTGEKAFSFPVLLPS